VAGVAGRAAEAVFAAVRAPFELPGDAAALCDPALFARPIMLTNARYRFLVAEQLVEIAIAADILLEPARRAWGGRWPSVIPAVAVA
jgi:hypothetical protein